MNKKLKFYMVNVMCLFLFTLSNLTLGQNSGNEAFLWSKDKSGEMLSTGEEIFAVKYEFPDTIKSFFIDTISGFIAFQLKGEAINSSNISYRGAGTILLFDSQLKQVAWQKTISPVERYYYFNQALVRLSGNKSYLVNLNTGEPLWSLNNIIYHVKPGSNTGIGYRFDHKYGISNVLEGIKLNSGQELWERNINRKYGWGDVYYLSDSTLLIAEEGLHKINLINGHGWDYSSATGVLGNRGAPISKELIIKRGLLVGSYKSNTPTNQIGQAGAPVILDGENYYFSSSTQLSKLDLEGNVSWVVQHSNLPVLDRELFTVEGMVYLINYGFYSNRIKLKTEKPFVAAFDLNNGAVVYKQPLTKRKYDLVKGYKVSENSLLFFFEDRVVQMDLQTGKKVQERNIDINYDGAIVSVLETPIYYQRADSTFLMLDISNPDQHFAYTKKGKVIFLNNKLQVFDDIGIHNIWYHYAGDERFKLIGNSDSTYILDQQNNKIARFQASGNSRQLGDYLYDIQGKRIVEFNLKAILDKVE